MCKDSSRTGATMLILMLLSFYLLASSAISSDNVGFPLFASAQQDRHTDNHVSNSPSFSVVSKVDAIFDNNSYTGDVGNNSNTNYPSVSPNPVGPSGRVKVSVNYTDNIGIANTILNINGPSMGSTDPHLTLPTIGSVPLSRVSGTMEDGMWSGTFTFATDAPDGNYLYSLIFTDTFGNSRTEGPFSGILLDRHPLGGETETKIVSALDGTGRNIGNNGTTFSRNMSFTFDGRANTGVVLFLQCNLDDTIVPSGMEHGAEEGMRTTYSTCFVPGKIAQQITGNYTYANLGVGNHTFKARVVDNEYNIDGTPAVFEWTILPDE